MAIEVIMILSIAGSMGMLNDTKQRTNGIGADLTLLPTGGSNMAGMNGAPMPAKFAEPIRQADAAAVVSPVIQKLSTSGKIEILYGIDYPSFNTIQFLDDVLDGPYTGLTMSSFVSMCSRDYVRYDTITVTNHKFRSRAQWSINNSVAAVAHRHHGQWIDRRGKSISLLYIENDDPPMKTP